MITGRDRDGDGVLADSEASGDPLALCPPTLETGVTRADPTPACPFGVEISMAPDESGQSADRESAAVSVCGASSSIAAVEAGRDLCPLGGRGDATTGG